MYPSCSTRFSLPGSSSGMSLATALTKPYANETDTTSPTTTRRARMRSLRTRRRFGFLLRLQRPTKRLSLSRRSDGRRIGRRMAESEALTRNAVHVLPEGELERKLTLGRPLRVKLGIDPTAPDIHVGHAIPLQRMAAFQRAGHIGVLIVGDYTGRIGDPSGLSTERPVLSDEEIDSNAKRYFEQAAQIIDPEKTEVRFNGEWLGRLDFPQVALTTPLLMGTDGRKMSASLGNYIGLAEPPQEQFGKTMRISDEALPEYYRLVMESNDDPPELEPMEAKLALARFIVTRSHSSEAATQAEAHFTRVVREGRAPDEVQEAVLPGDETAHLPALIRDVFGLSTSEARRLIAQGGVKLNGETLRDFDLPRAALEDGLLQVGKRQFVRLRAA